MSSMIVEGLMVTVAQDGRPHVAPMGPVVSPDLDQWTLRPFQTSTTFKNLRRHGHCVFHVTDDVLPIVKTALGLPFEFEFEIDSETADQAAVMRAPIIKTACRWFRLSIADWNVSQPRSELRAELHSQGSLRDFWGWNRAKHAILEGTILATRRHMLEPGVLAIELQRLKSAVEKTAGPRELQAWQVLNDFLMQQT